MAVGKKTGIFWKNFLLFYQMKKMANTKKINLDDFAPIEKIKAKVVARFDDKSFITLDELWNFRFHISSDVDYIKLQDLQANCYELESRYDKLPKWEEKDELKQEIRKLEKEILFLSRQHREAPYYVDSEGNPWVFLAKLQEEFREWKSIRQILRALGMPTNSDEIEDNRPLPTGYNRALRSGLSAR